MATDPLANVRTQVGLRIAEIRQRRPAHLPARPPCADGRDPPARRRSRPRRARRPRALLRAAGASPRSPGRAAILPRACRRSARQPLADATARPSSPRSPSACTRHSQPPFVHWRRNARLFAAARRSRLHALAQHQAQADRRLSQGNARPRPRLRPRRADRHARHPGGQARGGPRHRRGAGRPGAALHEPRLCRRHGRDGRAAVAERPHGEPPEIDDATISHHRRGRAAALGLAAGCAARRSPPCSTISTRRAGSRC